MSPDSSKYIIISLFLFIIYYLLFITIEPYQIFKTISLQFNILVIARTIPTSHGLFFSLTCQAAHYQYFEAPVPYELHDVCVNTKLIARNDKIQAPSGNGLDMEIDWDKVDEKTLHKNLGQP